MIVLIRPDIFYPNYVRVLFIFIYQVKQAGGIAIKRFACLQEDCNGFISITRSDCHFVEEGVVGSHAATVAFGERFEKPEHQYRILVSANGKLRFVFYVPRINALLHKEALNGDVRGACVVRSY